MTELIQNNQVAALAETDTDGNQSKYVVLQPLWHNRAWVSPGDDFNDSETNVSAVQLGEYLKKGYLSTREDYLKAQNPQAHQAQSENDELRAEIATLRQQVADAETSGGSGGGDEELKRYQELVGPLLPEGLAPKAKTSLERAGLVGKKLLSRVTDEELGKLPDVADATIKAVREFAPLQQ